MEQLLANPEFAAYLGAALVILAIGVALGLVFHGFNLVTINKRYTKKD